MRYTAVRRAYFLRRLNRFVAAIDLDGRETLAHVPNTGRCRELLVPGAEVAVQCSSDPRRRTAYTLIAVWKTTPGGPLLINLDSQAPNRVTEEALLAGWPPPGREQPARLVRREVVCGDSRFDFYLEGPGYRGYLEVKGVTLEEDGEVAFPDAPTLRGVRHLRELGELARRGWYAGVLFVVQMERADRFYPNRRTHPAFAEALYTAQAEGVAVCARLCRVTEDSLLLDREIPVFLSEQAKGEMWR